MVGPKLPNKADWNVYVEAHGIRAGRCDVCGEYVRILYRGETALLCKTCRDRQNGNGAPSARGRQTE